MLSIVVIISFAMVSTVTAINGGLIPTDLGPCPKCYLAVAKLLAEIGNHTECASVIDPFLIQLKLTLPAKICIPNILNVIPGLNGVCLTVCADILCVAKALIIANLPPLSPGCVEVIRGLDIADCNKTEPLDVTNINFVVKFNCEQPPSECVTNKSALQVNLSSIDTTYNITGRLCNFIDYYSLNDTRYETINGIPQSANSITYDEIDYSIDPRGVYLINSYPGTINTGPCAGDRFLETDYLPLKQLAMCGNGSSLTSLSGPSTLVYLGPKCKGQCTGTILWTLSPGVNGSGYIQPSCSLIDS